MHQIISFSRELGITLYPGQQAVLDGYYSSDRRNWLLLSGRRGGKSLLSDIICAYEALIPDFTNYQRPGEERYVILVSVREDSAKLHIRQITRLLRHNRSIARRIVAVKDDRIILDNNCVILALPASGRAGRGYGASTLVMDEAAFFIDSLGNSSAEAIYTALEPTTATYSPMSRIVITTSVGAKSGLVYDLYDRSLSGELDDYYVTKATSQQLNPKISDRVINAALKRDLESAQAEYFSEFREQTENFLNSEAILQCVDRDMRRLEKGSDQSYLMAVDPALLSDNYAYGIMHKEKSGVMVLDYIQRLRAPVDALAAEDLLRSLVERFKPRTVLCDNASTCQRLKNEVPMEYCPFSRQQKLRIYSALKESINLGQLILPNDEDLLAELKALQIRNGVDISAPKAGRVVHDDMADVVALLVDGLQRLPGGEATVIADPFAFENGWGLWELAGNPPAEDYTYSPYYGWRTNNHPKHSPGATSWRDCAYRRAGCDQCMEESQNEDSYKNTPETTPLSKEAFLTEIAGRISKPTYVEDPRETRARKWVKHWFHKKGF